MSRPFTIWISPVVVHKYGLFGSLEEGYWIRGCLLDEHTDIAADPWNGSITVRWIEGFAKLYPMDGQSWEESLEDDTEPPF